jgi:hypothetical protein
MPRRPCQALPALPHRTLPNRTEPSPPCLPHLANPDRAAHRPAKPRLRCRASFPPLRSMPPPPGGASPALHCLPSLHIPLVASPALPCSSGRSRSRPFPTETRLACLAVPCPPILTAPGHASPFLGRRLDLTHRSRRRYDLADAMLRARQRNRLTDVVKLWQWVKIEN